MNFAYDALLAAKKSYTNLLEKVSSIVNDLSDSIDSLRIVVDKFDSIYVVDGECADDNKISRYRKELVERRNKMKNVIIPAINEEIKKIERSMSELKMK